MQDIAHAKYLRVREVVAHYRIGRTKLYELLGDGVIYAVRDGNRTLIDKASADAYFSCLPPFSPRAKWGSK
jgi:excisionase family DNA binding protein